MKIISKAQNHYIFILIHCSSINQKSREETTQNHGCLHSRGDTEGGSEEPGGGYVLGPLQLMVLDVAGKPEIFSKTVDQVTAASVAPSSS